jgi:hypothetical protein
MFKQFSFSKNQIEKYYKSALRDFSLSRSDNPEIIFVFSYNCLLKLAITVCAKNNLRIQPRLGHHVALIEKMSELLDNQDIALIADDMRSKRNKDLYDGGVIISLKEAKLYHEFVANLIKQVEKYLGKPKLI